MRSLFYLLIFILPITLTAENFIDSGTAMEILKQGNMRFFKGKPAHPNQNKKRRIETAQKGQKPFATVISCSDSRVPVEILFDQGIGDIFNIKVAGNVCDVDEIASIEYGVDHLETPLMVVLGHTGCGAVTAVCTDAKLHGSIPLLIDNIIPAVNIVRQAHPDLSGKSLIPYAVRQNVFQSISDLLKHSSAVRKRIENGTLLVIAAVYNMKTGAVEWLGPHPSQDRLLAKYGTNQDPSHNDIAVRHGTGISSGGKDGNNKGPANLKESGFSIFDNPIHGSTTVNYVVLGMVLVLSTALVFFGVTGFVAVRKFNKAARD